MIISATGHREIDNVPLCERKIDNYIIENVKIDLMIIGCAKGFDTMVGWKCVEYEIPFDMYLPFPTSYYDRELKRYARSFHILNSEYSNKAFFIRDKKMVDDSNGVIAWYDGRSVGGTFITVTYANSIKRPVVNLYELQDNMSRMR